MPHREEIEAAIKVVFPGTDWLEEDVDVKSRTALLQYNIIVECWIGGRPLDGEYFCARVTWDHTGTGEFCRHDRAVGALKAACDLFCRQTEAEVKALTTRLQFVNRFR